MQNERLTLKAAAKTDVWLHAQKIPGAHVVISANGGEVGDTTLHQAAVLAATFSQSRGGGKVAVDYTLVRNVRKCPGPAAWHIHKLQNRHRQADEALAED